ncbi:MAG: transcriptional regulator [Pseudonocardiaceae bacterium]
MNVTGGRDARLSLETWNEPEMKRALAARDISSVYRLLRREGISQRHIAALTGQSQSEVSEILKGRQVMAYDVLVRISVGLGIPRGYMGLSYDPATAMSLVGPPDKVDEVDKAKAEKEKAVKRRKLLAHGSAMLFGTTTLGADRGPLLPGHVLTPMPNRIGVMDVKQVEATTRALRALDYEFGGGNCRDAVVAQLAWAQRLLGASGKDEVRLRLFRALGDLQGLAGWTSFDVGLRESAHGHYSTALEFANQAGDSILMARIMFWIGRIYLHDREANEALKWFQLGQLAAQRGGSERAVALLCANEAWAYAIMKDDEMAQKLLDRSESELALAELHNEVPNWAQDYDSREMFAMIGTVHAELAATKPRHTNIAIPALRECLALYDTSTARSRTFNLTSLATSYLRDGEVNLGIQTGRKTLLTVPAIKSTRVLDRLQPLESELMKRPHNSDSRDLCHQIRQFRTV